MGEGKSPAKKGGKRRSGHQGEITLLDWDGRYVGMYEGMKSCGMEERYLVGERYDDGCCR